MIPIADTTEVDIVGQELDPFELDVDGPPVRRLQRVRDKDLPKPLSAP